MGAPGFPPPPDLTPGWYPDPTGRYEARYWDGRKWTGHISHYGALGSDPVRRARVESRLGAGVLWTLKAVTGLAVVGALAYAGWKLWPFDDQDTEADQALADTAMVRLEDVPPGWIVTVPLQGLLGVEEVPEECGVLGEALAAVADAPTGYRTVGSPEGTLLVVSAVSVTEDEAAASAVMDALEDPSAAACLEALFPQVLAGGGDGNVEIESLDARQLDATDVGDDSVSWRLQGRLTGFVPVDVTLDLVVVRSGRSLAELTFRALVDGSNPTVQREAVFAVVDRLESPPEDPTTAPDDQGPTDDGATEDGTTEEDPTDDGATEDGTTSG